jgi:hypothetical protein
MLSIRFLGDGKHPALMRDASDAAWLRTPVGAAGKAGAGPANTTCGTCSFLDLAASRWSTHGRCAPCLKRRHMNGGQGAAPVPTSTPSCAFYLPHADTLAGLAADANRVEERVQERRAKIRDLKSAVTRLEEEIADLEKERESVGAG